MRSDTPRLTLCMIVKNEAAMLPECLDSVKGLADEILIVDTGSTDDTIRIAESHGACVQTRAWTDDFSAARNVSIGNAQGEWILWLDADERLRPAEFDRIRKAMGRRNVDVYNVPILNQDGKGGYFSKGHRLFRNGKGIAFSGAVHEQISPSFQRANAKVEDAEFTIEHLGYNLAADQMAVKNARNIRLLNQSKANDPRDAYVRFTLGQAHMIAGDKAAGEREIQAALGEIRTERMRKPLPRDIRASGLNNLAECALERGAHNEALERCRSSLRLCPEQTTAHLMAYQVYKAMGDAAGALKELRAADDLLARRTTGAHTAVEVTVDRDKLKYTMAQLALQSGQPAEAIALVDAFLAKHPAETQALTLRVRCAMATGRFQEAIEYGQRALELDGHNAALLDLLSLAHIKLNDFENASVCLTRLLSMVPHETAIRRRLAGVLVKLGRPEAAKDVLLAGPSAGNAER